jgi:small conductance mechanosensitive channel
MKPRKITTRLWLLACLVAFVPALAQEPASELLPLPEEVAARFDETLATIDEHREDLATIRRRSQREEEGFMADLLAERFDRLWILMFRDVVDVAKELIGQREDGYEVDSYWKKVGAELSALPAEIVVAIGRVNARTEFPSSDLETREFVIADRELFAAVKAQNDLFRAMKIYVEVAEEFGLDPEAERDSLVERLTEFAAILSVFLQKAQADVEVLRDATITLPNDAELTDWLSAGNARVGMTAEAMQDVAGLMDDLGLETRFYRQQLLTATGEITADVLDVGLVAGLVMDWASKARQILADEGPRILFRLLLVVLILLIFVQLGNLARKLADTALNSSRVQVSQLLRNMIVSIIRNIVILFGALIAISQLGISLGPLLAGLGIMGFIIGFALQDTLSNFASGVMILFYRPFDVGDTVISGEVSGKIDHMSLVNTTFLTFDNQRLIVPNNMIWGSVITNLTAQYTRRVDLVFGVSYDEDIERVEKILHEIVDNYEAVLDSPEPMIKVVELADSSVNIAVRPWVKTEDYWDTYWDLTRAVKLRFDKEGISIPYPQQDVHIIKGPES